MSVGFGHPLGVSVRILAAKGELSCAIHPLNRLRSSAKSMAHGSLDRPCEEQILTLHQAGCLCISVLGISSVLHGKWWEPKMNRVTTEATLRLMREPGTKQVNSMRGPCAGMEG